MADPAIIPAVIHDAVASKATFLEICFGVNVGLAAFHRFRDLFRKQLDKKIVEISAWVTLMETGKPAHASRVAKLKEKVESFAKKHHLFQNYLCHAATALSIFTALAVMVVLYFDLIEKVGRHLYLFALPLPIYLILSILLSRFYYVRCYLPKRQYQKFMNDFEAQPPDKVIQEGIDSLKE